MSRLYFNRATRSIALRDSTGLLVGSWSAHNQVASSANGPWPLGSYQWSHYKAHLEAGLMPGCFPTAYGCFGIHVFSVDGRPGIGVHAGRTRGETQALGGVTMGCIRVTSPAMETINALHNRDKLTDIAVVTFIDLIPQLTNRAFA